MLFVNNLLLGSEHFGVIKCVHGSKKVWNILLYNVYRCLTTVHERDIWLSLTVELTVWANYKSLTDNKQALGMYRTDNLEWLDEHEANRPHRLHSEDPSKKASEWEEKTEDKTACAAHTVQSPSVCMLLVSYRRTNMISPCYIQRRCKLWPKAINECRL